MDGKFVNDLGRSNVKDGVPLVVENAGPVSVTLKAVSNNPLRHTVRITLFANNPRIDIEDSIQSNFGGVKSWAFSFNLNDPTTRHEELGAILTAKKETRGGHYAADNARYDWQTFNHFATLSEPGYGITLSNTDCSFFKLGNSTTDSLWEQSAQLNALAGGNVDKKVEDGGILGILNQHGNKDFLYKFALWPHVGNFNPVKEMKGAMEHQTPLVTGMINGPQKKNAANSYSLLQVSDDNLLLWAVKPSEDGISNGLITRFWNMGKTAAQPELTLSVPIKKAWSTSHIETNEASVPVIKQVVKMNFRGQQIRTYRVLTPVK